MFRLSAEFGRQDILRVGTAYLGVAFLVVCADCGALNG